MKSRFRTLIKRLVANIGKPEMRILPGQLAFFFLITLTPLLALLVNVISKLNVPINLVEDTIINNIPSTMSGFFNSISTSTVGNIDLFIFFISALILASNGTHSIIIACNKIYNIRDNTYFKRRIKAIIMLLVLICLLLFIVLVPVFGDMVMNIMTSIINQSVILKVIKLIYHILKYPVSLFLIFMSIKLLYFMAPDMNIKSREVNYGAIFTSIMWVVVTQFYSLYVQKFSNYNNFYGNLSNLIVLMWWVYILAYIFVLGMALNATKYQLKEANK